MKKLRKRYWIPILLLGIAAWRLWPLAGIFSGSNVPEPSISEGTRLPEMLPPASAPDLVLNGFAHPHFQRKELIAQVIFFPRTLLHGHVFHWSARKDSLGADIASILAEPGSLVPWQGRKMCGGFHADYALRWNQPAHPMDAIVCMGCHEVILYRNGIALRCDMNRGVGDRIHAAEKAYSASP